MNHTDYKGRSLNGNPAVFFARHMTTIAPEGSPVQVGDRVTVINAYGVRLEGLTVLGFVPEDRKDAGKFYVNWDCYWFPLGLERLVLGGTS